VGVTVKLCVYYWSFQSSRLYEVVCRDANVYIGAQCRHASVSVLSHTLTKYSRQCVTHITQGPGRTTCQGWRRETRTPTLLSSWGPSYAEGLHPQGPSRFILQTSPTTTCLVRRDSTRRIRGCARSLAPSLASLYRPRAGEHLLRRSLSNQIVCSE
jgi:hypothetical protein